MRKRNRSRLALSTLFWSAERNGCIVTNLVMRRELHGKAFSEKF